MILIKLKKQNIQALTFKTADKGLGRENLQDFIQKKREMFLVQYALGVKREEMRKLEEIAQVTNTNAD
jgi:hypothetical protein